MSPDPAKIRAQVDALIARLQELGKSVNPLDLLSRVAFHHLMKREGAEAEHMQSEAQVEYLMSLFLSSAFPQNPAAANPGQIQECIDVLDEMYSDATLYYALAAESKKGDRNETQVILSQRLHTLHVRGDAYQKHTLVTFRAIAAAHDPFLQAAYGFVSADLLDTIKHAAAHVQQSIDAEFSRARAAMEPFTRKMADFMKSEPKQEEIAKFQQESATEIAAFQNAADGLGAPAMFAVPPRDAKDNAIFNLIATQFGGNAPFVTALRKWVGWPLNSTVIHTRPLIVHEGTFYVFHLPLFARNPLGLVEALIRAHSETYWQNTFLKKRDDYVETTVIDLISGILAGCATHKNLYYHYTEGTEQRRAELDGLILYDDCLLIVEVKASGLSDAAKRGAPERIVEDLTASLDKAFEQASRVLALMRSTAEVPFLDERNSEVCRIRFADFKQHFLVSGTREQFASLATQLHLIRKLGLIKGVEWPWAVSLSDLRVISEITTHPTVFLHYLVRRLEVNSFEAIATVDELDLFGHFLSTGLFFRDDDIVRNNNQVVLDGFTEEFDAYYRAEENGTPIVKPRYPLPARIEELLGVIEQVRPSHFATAALQILAYGTAGLTKLDDQIAECEGALQRGRVRIAGINNTVYADAATVLFACIPRLGSAQEITVVDRAKNNPQRTALCTLILWEPPLAQGHVRVHIL